LRSQYQKSSTVLPVPEKGGDRSIHTPVEGVYMRDVETGVKLGVQDVEPRVILLVAALKKKLVL
jgi:hypothetical protein